MNNVDLKSKTKGTIVEYECALYLMKLGYTVSTPIGDNAQYDLVVDIEHSLYKIQCKSPSYNGGSIYIECTTNINTRTRLETHPYDSKNVDLFATYYDGTCYLIPFSDVKKSSFTLRIDNPKNNCNLGAHWIENYEAEIVIYNMLHPKSNIDNTRGCRSIEPKITNTHFYWITDGKVNKRFVGNIDEIPDGFYRGRCSRCNQFS